MLHTGTQLFVQYLGYVALPRVSDCVIVAFPPLAAALRVFCQSLRRLTSLSQLAQVRQHKGCCPTAPHLNLQWEEVGVGVGETTEVN